ncbi:hypothetical protein FN846DRAFT_924161 [Sphaerosporella brunnea]|uniref:Uncharacterized protein n=1 Tax=Sphaerosporella brunnea TaxID=1250544 RepID=A0A5J5EB22_9PEZI|nr:hypothetical protein FN846DRAFT_924161 [Sphaerosporella brunnea]
MARQLNSSAHASLPCLASQSSTPIVNPLCISTHRSFFPVSSFAMLSRFPIVIPSLLSVAILLGAVATDASPTRTTAAGLPTRTTISTRTTMRTSSVPTRTVHTSTTTTTAIITTITGPCRPQPTDGVEGWYYEPKKLEGLKHIARTTEGVLTTMAHTYTVTVTRTKEIHAGPCVPTPSEPVGKTCPPGSSYELLTFDKFYDNATEWLTAGITTPNNGRFDYEGFIFDGMWSFAVCQNLMEERNKTCNPATMEGSYYLSLYYYLNSDNDFLPPRRIYWDVENKTSTWEVLSFSLSAFPKPDQTFTVVMCAWSVNEPVDAIKPTFCHAEYFSGAGQNNILRPVMIEKKNQELAFIQFIGWDGFYSVGEESVDPGLQPAEFFVEDLAVCVQPK